MLSVFIPGPPGAKGRPRFNRASGRAYTPSKTLRYESYVRAAMAEAMGDRALFDGPTAVAMVFHMPEPKSMRKRDAGRQLPHTKRPDLDNLMKAVLDAANGVVVTDDSVICAILARKQYGEKPGVRIEFTEEADLEEY